MDKESLPKLYGVLGYPVKHSFSPLMQNKAFQALKINAKYLLFEKRPEEIDGFLHSLRKENIYGLNITIPYKEKILDFVRLNKESSYLGEIKAVNTIALENGIWNGFNTDIPGFSKALREHIDPKNKRAAILGAGGAGRAVAYALALSGVSEISIFDIDEFKSRNVTDMVKKLFPNFAISPVYNIEKLDIKNKDLLINATPVGLKKTDPCLVREEMLDKNLFVYDLIYNPPETELLAIAKKAGAKVANGLGMLLYQGMLSFQIWTGQKAPKEIMQKALLGGL